MGQHSSKTLEEEPTYVSERVASSDHHYSSLGQQKNISRVEESPYVTHESTSTDHPYASLGTPSIHAGQDLSNLKGHVYTINIVPTDLSATLELDGRYHLQLKDLSICLSEEQASETLHAWPLKFIRGFQVNSQKNDFLIEVGRKAKSGPGKIKCQFQENFSDLLRDISNITGINFESELVAENNG